MSSNDFDFERVFEPSNYLYFYADVLTPEQTKKEVEFLIRELGLRPPMNVLDLACGYGRHANRLAEIGCDVTGVDLTPGFLEIARKEAEEMGVSDKVRYVLGDMRKISFKEEFDRALLLFVSFGYFTDEENLLVLKNVNRALKPGGLFCFDISNRDVSLKNLPPCSMREKGDDLMIEKYVFESTTGRLNTKRIEIRNSKREDKHFFVRLYNPTEIRDLLERAGFSVLKIFGNWDGKPLDSSSTMIIIAKKIAQLHS